MIKVRRTKTLTLGNQDVKHIVVLESPNCDKDSPEYDFLRFNILKLIVESPDIVNCGGHNFENFKMTYNGISWIIEVSYEEKKNLP